MMIVKPFYKKEEVTENGTIDDLWSRFVMSLSLFFCLWGLKFPAFDERFSHMND